MLDYVRDQQTQLEKDKDNLINLLSCMEKTTKKINESHQYLIGHLED